MQITHVLSANISQFHRVVYIYSDVVPPIHVVSYHVATDKPPPKMATSSGLFLEQSIATRGKKARGTLLVDKHCGNGCSIKRAPLSVSYYNEISGGHNYWASGCLEEVFCRPSTAPVVNSFRRIFNCC